MIVLDASAAVLGLVADGTARELMASERISCPHLVDSQVTEAFRKLVLRHDITTGDAARALDRWRRLGIERFPTVGLLPRVWDLRDNVTAYDATYVALAETLEVAVVTGDHRLAQAPGPRCPITIVHP